MKKKTIKLSFKNKQNSFVFVCRFNLIKALNKNFYYNKKKHRSSYKVYNRRFIFFKNL